MLLVCTNLHSLWNLICGCWKQMFDSMLCMHWNHCYAVHVQYCVQCCDVLCCVVLCSAMLCCFFFLFKTVKLSKVQVLALYRWSNIRIDKKEKSNMNAWRWLISHLYFYIKSCSVYIRKSALAICDVLLWKSWYSKQYLLKRQNVLKSTHRQQK